MAQFDPAAATQAYLATLPPEAHAKATAYTQGGHWVLLWAAIVSILVAWLVLRSGVLVKVRNAVQAKKSRPWLAVAAVVIVDAVIEGLLTLPWSAYEDWWRQKSYGLTDQAFGGWMGETLTMLVISLVMTVALASGVYAVMRRAPRTWWAWSGGLVAVAFMVIMVLAPVFIEPLFNTYTPAPPGPVRDTVVTMANTNGVPSDKIYVYNGSKQSNRYTANVSGLFGTARVAMSDTMFKQGADLAEVRGVVGHEMGHYVHMHSIWLASAFGGLALVLFFLVDRMFAPVARLLGAKGVDGISDPAGLPVIWIIIAVLSLLATPITSSLVRIAETDADRFSLERFNEPDGLAKALVKTIEYRAATPSKLEEVLFYDHPSVGGRVRMAMDWKAAHPPKSEPIY
ncbi:MAG: M48 family metallopeptidase [Phenylobacterium sp.]|uniref:M48 family metallopeptidase n=1 Tax=Phenylobacterium sp. TaxID=1871053 RepID=UPI001B66B746|nr:M48 family metallopeptidase [Phenylobacterium sp.]MBP7650274.1 M48 family metallopeptidase [Phenylobacterium sp.]MBP7815933.1 M48 family metallopeptidase [Phenylobacterium sp.]MBP9230117.1 M48 family metallopeptidase [Phenylobacterium sp.]MBP9756699.1 M48 family metallopeptidase [Phenylobacterium sp.]